MRFCRSFRPKPDARRPSRSFCARDPVMEKLKKLPENVRNRELFFIGQSANGYLGWIRRAAAAR